MLRLRNTVIASLVMLSVGIGQAGAQPSKLPVGAAKVPAAIREEIDRLASDDAGRRATAAFALGEMGAAAELAIPWLVAAMSDDRRTLSTHYGDAPVNLVVGKALARIGSAATKHVTTLLLSDDTRIEMRLNSARALTVMRDGTSLELLLKAIPYAYSQADMDGDRKAAFATEFRRLLPCYLPDRRVPEAFLTLEEAAQRASPSGPTDVQWFVYEFRESVKNVPMDVQKIEQARDWWSQNKATASLNPARTWGICKQ
jgi:hypothetical protein